MTYASRKDGNQHDMEAELRELGFHVADTSRLGRGFPDMVVTGYNRIHDHVDALLVEVKSADGTLTRDEKKFWRGYPDGGPFIVAHCTDDVLRWFGAIDEEGERI